MNAKEAISKMISPNTPRHKKPDGGVIQILVTSSCTLQCRACTQNSQLRRKPWFMTPDQFEQAVLSLTGYFGIRGCFGGCPCLSPYFEDYCRILRQHVPKEKCGLWTNDLVGKGRFCRDTFNPAVSNLNVHLDRKAYDEMLRDWPESRPFGLVQDSRHSPVMVALKDVVSDESERWELISNCTINRFWSALVGVFRGELRAWFCEIAGSQSILYQDDPNYPDTGYDPTKDYHPPGSSTSIKWWQLPMAAFSHQVYKHCHDCGIPLNGYGQLAQAPEELGGEQVSETHREIFKPKRKDRKVELVLVREQLQEGRISRAIDYLQNSTK